MAPPQVDVPDWCASVSPECPVEGTIYGYAPNLAVNAFFAGFFGLAAIINLILGVKYKTWTYMIALMLGCAGECVGYIGRLMLHNNAYDETGFQIQIVMLIFCPAFLAAGIYLTLKHIVITFGESWSRLRPAWYTYIFIACDISSLVLQSAGGAMAATADDGSNTLDIGTNIMIAGIIWQVVVLVIFGIMTAEYAVRTYRNRFDLTPDALALWNNRPFRYFIGAVIVAYVGIFVRCVYRIPELIEGWGSELMRNEIEFIVLEGVMIVITVAAQTIFHPGLCFPALGNTFGAQKRQRVKSSDADGSDMEMMSYADDR